MATGGDVDDARAELIAQYGFAIPADDALDAITRWSPGGVIEIGAGTGYWAHLLEQRGVDVVAFDVEPAPSPRNAWFAGTPPWHPVHPADHGVVRRYPDRTLLIIWPTKNEMWAAEAIEWFYDAGGTRLVYIGEGPGGRTGDDVFHASLGGITTCAQCVLGSMLSPCICGAIRRWQWVQTIALPHWPDCGDDVHLYTRQLGGWLRRRPGRPRLSRVPWNFGGGPV